MQNPPSFLPPLLQLLRLLTLLFPQQQTKRNKNKKQTTGNRLGTGSTEKASAVTVTVQIDTTRRRGGRGSLSEANTAETTASAALLEAQAASDAHLPARTVAGGTGKADTLKANERGQDDNNNNPLAVSALTCGSRHSVMLTPAGDVAVCGHNFFGQIGYDLNKENYRAHLVSAHRKREHQRGVLVPISSLGSAASVTLNI